MLFPRFWTQQLICWVCPKFVASAEEKSCRMEMRRGSEGTLECCFVDSNIGRNIFACWREGIVFVIPQREELKNAHKSRIMHRVRIVQILVVLFNYFNSKAWRQIADSMEWLCQERCLTEPGMPVPLGRDSHWALVGRAVTVFTLF